MEAVSKRSQAYIQSDISLASPKHYFRDVFRVQISTEEQPVCNILLPLSSFGLLNISECHLVILLNSTVSCIHQPLF